MQSLGTSYGPWARILATCAYVLLSALWNKAVAARARPGLARLLVAAPVLAANVALPFAFDWHTERIRQSALFFVVSWMTNLKVLAFCMNRGPLVILQDAGFIEFAATSFFCITPKKVASYTQGKSSAAAILQRWLTSTGMFIVAALFIRQMDQLPWILVCASFVFFVYAFLGSLLDGPALLVTLITGIELSPHFDEFWKTTSVADLWSRRWNIVTGQALKHVAASPIIEGRWVHRSGGSKKYPAWRKSLGMAMTFVLSGVLHHLLFRLFFGYFDCRWFLFFFLQIPLIAAEDVAKRRALRAGFRLPPRVSGAATIITVSSLGYWLFFQPLMGTNGMGYVLDEVDGFRDSLLGVLQLLMRMDFMVELSRVEGGVYAKEAIDRMAKVLLAGNVTAFGVASVN